MGAQIITYDIPGLHIIVMVWYKSLQQILEVLYASRFLSENRGARLLVRPLQLLDF